MYMEFPSVLPEQCSVVKGIKQGPFFPIPVPLSGYNTSVNDLDELKVNSAIFLQVPESFVFLVTWD